MSQMLIESLEARELFSSYFVDAQAGSDQNTGRSPRLPWQSLAAVNEHAFHRGDHLYLTGTFTGMGLVLGASDAGLSVNSYALVGRTRSARLGVAGAAVLADMAGTGIEIGTSNISIQNLTITAASDQVSSGNYNYGIYLHNSTNKVLTHELINRVSVTGFSYSGLCMQGWNTSTTDSAGFSNVLIENSSFYSNQVSGIFVGAGDATGNEFQPDFPAAFHIHSKLTIRNCRAYDNAGANPALQATPDGVNINQGNYTSGGILISSVDSALVQNCTVYNNCFAALGSVGTWAFDATRVNFLHDESYDNKTLGGDGDGFDFDHGVTHSIMQRDYSHGNQGFGFLLTTTGGTSNDDIDTIRDCLSTNNNGELTVLSVPGVPVLGATIFHNILVASDTSPANSSAIAVEGDAGASVNLQKNTFFSNGADPVGDIGTIAPLVRFTRNDYWVALSPTHFNISSQGTDYDSLTAWSAATGGQEQLRGRLIGLVRNPMIQLPFRFA